MPVTKSRSSHEENRPKTKGSKSSNTNSKSKENHEDTDESHKVTVKDLRLPDATVFKLMKEALPKNAVISQEVKDVMRRVPTIFALFVTDHALQQTHAAKRRTLLPEDVVAALDTNGFGSYSDKVMPVVEKRRANFRSRKPKLDEGSSGGVELKEEPSTGNTDIAFRNTAHIVQNSSEFPDDVSVNHGNTTDVTMEDAVPSEDGDSEDGSEEESGSVDDSLEGSGEADQTEDDVVMT